jgi:uncharacterized protein YdeI (YjbR/CyaY-like superfamily)
MSAPNPKVDWYFDKATTWKREVVKLRKLALASGLDEALKWGAPCYALDGANVFLIHMFKDYCALLFHKGALLKDPSGLLIQQTKNVQSARQLRFASAAQIDEQSADIKAYMAEAIALERAGAKVEFKTTREFEMPAEFQRQLDELPELKDAFYGLTPGRQRAYLLHFAGAKQAKTREARIQKYLQHILNGKGLDDD